MRPSCRTLATSTSSSRIVSCGSDETCASTPRGSSSWPRERRAAAPSSGLSGTSWASFDSHTRRTWRCRSCLTVWCWILLRARRSSWRVRIGRDSSMCCMFCKLLMLTIADKQRTLVTLLKQDRWKGEILCFERTYHAPSCLHDVGISSYGTFELNSISLFFPYPNPFLSPPFLFT
ncbi:hypothetical protein M441DRAFT_248014 [Trichoderma asperellum CBS 433.97]|uniref:Uncharacterized protein n=1 Tax=Trichoderma asperellum (strain ATCC 204424 / CBS 433.97 / NBRC 101777) TaxID=1042311 RepID=A0A2T3Z042_TRIA4|nr:hypothetical protein M441DRAFT_248014 [Trichoderma asperellum CBS 433.97]PTB38178.1 hypothetical protein M441DRAFT_248014 [Trichoderma asperellum CBS 433.97]